MSAAGPARVVIVGGGFAGVGCARRLAGRPDVHVTLLDRHNYQQFQPLLYQVATSQLPAAAVGFSLRAQFAGHPNVDVKLADVAHVDLARRTVTTAHGATYEGDALVLAAGGVPNYFGTPGAEEHALPLYSLPQAVRLNSRMIGLFEQADLRPGLIDEGALSIVVVGAGATGTEVSGAIADMLRETMTVEYQDLPVDRAEVHLVDRDAAVLGAFSGHAQAYAQRVLADKGVRLHLGVGVQEVAGDHVRLEDGARIPSRCVVWAGGNTASPLGSGGGFPTGRGGRVDVGADLRAAGMPGVYVVGDMANIADRSGTILPQLGSVALQSGACAADNILAERAGRPTRPFRYRDKGIMAMIGRGAAVAEVGRSRREIDGLPAFVAWLGVHAMLMSGRRTRVEALIGWTWDYFAHTRGPQLLVRPGEFPRPDAPDPPDAEGADGDPEQARTAD